MKAKVNPKTGMVALVATKSVMNVKEGKIFGALPKDAAVYLSKKHATLCKELPEASAKWKSVDINVEQGVAGKTEPMSTEKSPEPQGK